MAACPAALEDEFEERLRTRKAIYRPGTRPTMELRAIDRASCTRCGECVMAADGQGIVLMGVPSEEVIQVGAVIVATGYDHYRPAEGEYGCGRSERVITLPQLVRRLDPTGPTGGQLRFDGKRPRSVAFIHCVGSRQIAGVDEPGPQGRLNEYRSRVCCTATLHGHAAGHERGSATLSGGDGVRPLPRHPHLREGAGTLLRRFLQAWCDLPALRQRVQVAVAAAGEDNPLTVTVSDTLTFGRELEVPADLVVLGVGMEPHDVADIIEMAKTPVGADGFLLEVHPSCDPWRRPSPASTSPAPRRAPGTSPSR